MQHERSPRWEGLTAEGVLLGLLLGGIAIGCVLVLYPFVSAMLWAAILVFTTWPVCETLRQHLRLGRAGAALLMVTLTAVFLVLPIALAAPAAVGDLAGLRASTQNFFEAPPAAPHWLYAVPVIGPILTDYWNAWAADFSGLLGFFRPYLGLIAARGVSLLLSIADGVVQFVMALFIAFFFWLSGEALGLHLQSIMRRIAGHYADELITVVSKTVRGTVYGILGTAVVQGVLTIFGLWLAGVPRPALFGTLAALLAVLPIGAPLVWIPAALWLISDGATGHGIFLLVYGVIAISGADHLIRPYFIARGAQLPFLLTVLGVLGGVLAFGVLGIFVGPVLLGLGYGLVTEFARTGEPQPVPFEYR